MQTIINLCLSPLSSSSSLPDADSIAYPSVRRAGTAGEHQSVVPTGFSFVHIQKARPFPEPLCPYAAGLRNARCEPSSKNLKWQMTCITHDLRTPLTSIIGYLDLMEQQEQTEAGAEYLSIVKQKSESCRNSSPTFMK